MDQLAGPLSLTSPRRLLGLERFEPPDPRGAQPSGDGGARQRQPFGDLGAGHPIFSPKMLRDGAPVVRMAVPRPGGRA
ncbi:MAG: hypothetical protein AAGM38_18380 [Pseudomonadota bacterium]